MPDADEVIERARRLAVEAFEDLSAFSGVDTDFAHAVLDAWYEREQQEKQSAGVDYFRRQAAFHLLLGLTCLPGASPASPYLEMAGAAGRPAQATTGDDPAGDADATPVDGIPRSDPPAKANEIKDKLTHRERRRRG